MYELTEEDKKALTKLLREHWYTWDEVEGYPYYPPNRKFATLQDVTDLKAALVKDEKWKLFLEAAMNEFLHKQDLPHRPFSRWLLNPARFCWLVRQAQKEGAIGG
jgi:hypothetical protein